MSRFVLIPALILSLAVSPASPAGPVEDRVRLVEVPQGGSPMAAQRGPDGIVHLAYERDGEPWYTCSNDKEASSFRKPIPVVEPGSRKPKLHYDCRDMAVDSRGGVHIALFQDDWMYKDIQASLKDEVGFMHASLEPGGKAFSPLRSLSRIPSDGYALAADAKGRVGATWFTEKLFVRLSDDGKTFGKPLALEASWRPCSCCTTRAAFGPDGSLACLYREETRNERDMYVFLVGKNGKVIGREKVSATPWKTTNCPMTYWAISGTDSGFAAAWPTKGEVYAARLDSKGKLRAPGEIRTPGRTGMREGILALEAPDGTLLVAWKHQGQLGWQLYDEKGKPMGEPGTAPSPGPGIAGVTDGKGGFLLLR